ncbi:MAG: hypothetical protein MJ249_09255 [Kiritimatiellae bacterium]|nr:hypothetical protein [Kiritimatiellia bacterium]
MADGIISILKKRWALEVSLAQGEDWNRDDAKMLQVQLRILMNAYFSNEIDDIIPMLKRDLHTIGDSTLRKMQRKYCGTGTNMATYDVDGKVYGCHMFTPLVLGKDKALELKDRDLTNDLIPLDDRCVNCILAGFCSTCMGFNYRYRGDLGRKDMRFCLMNLAIAKSALEFQTKALAMNKEFSETEAEYAKAVLSASHPLSLFECEDAVDPFVLKS